MDTLYRKVKAKFILLEIEAIKTGDFTDRTSDLLAMVNEILKDAKDLAESTLKDEDFNKNS